MKLVLCKKCQDIFKFDTDGWRTCKCKAVGGMYIDDLNVEYYGDNAVVIGIDNRSLVAALNGEKYTGDVRLDELLNKDFKTSNKFTAFIIKKAKSLKKIKKPS